MIQHKLFFLFLSQSAGNFVVVDESGKKEALESGSKVGCIVVQVLVYEQVRALQKSPEWCVLVNNFDSHSFSSHTLFIFPIIQTWMLYGGI